MQSSWVISAMECRVLEGTLENVVSLVHWRYQARQEQGNKIYFAERYGATAVGEPDPENFTPYESLTQEQVIAWLEATLDVAEMNTTLKADIELQMNPVTVTLKPSWNQTV